jgi:hypothetical protein
VSLGAVILAATGGTGAERDAIVARLQRLEIVHVHVTRARSGSEKS